MSHFDSACFYNQLNFYHVCAYYMLTGDVQHHIKKPVTKITGFIDW